MSENNQSSLSQEKASRSQAGPDWSILEKLAGKYDGQERSRVDRIKEDIRNDRNHSSYEEKQLDVSPSRIRKLGRIAMDSLGIRSRKSEERREREAVAVALREYHEEENSRRIAWEEKNDEEKKMMNAGRRN